jgi:hypothetical protein
MTDHDLTRRRLTAADLAEIARADRKALPGVLAGADEDALAELLATQEGEPVLHAVMTRMPEFYTGAPFDPPVVVRWHVRRAEPADPVRYDLVLDRAGSCAVAPTPVPAPPADVTFTLGAVDFLRMAFGADSGMNLLMAGHLAVAGDGNLAVRLESLFGLDAGTPS